MHGIVKEVFKQLFPNTPKDTQIVFTKSAREQMGAWGVPPDKVKQVVLSGEQIKDLMIVKQFNGYSIGTITKYNKATKTYLVLSVWKREWE